MKNIFRGAELKHSMLRNFIILISWWLIFFPGFYSGDSFGAVEMAKTGNLTNSFTASWALYVRVFSFYGHAIGLLTLINGLLLVYATTQFSYALFKKNTAAISSFLLTATPVISGIGITLWHDVLMTAGLLLVVAFIIKLNQRNSITNRDIYCQLILGAILVSFRPNGLPTLLLFAFIYLVLTRRKLEFRYLLLTVITTILVTLIGSNLILGLNPINSYYAQEWMRNDISCFAHTSKGAGFVEKNIPNIGNTDSWKSKEACTFLNQALISSEEKAKARKYVPAAWFKLIKQEPYFVLGTHAERNSYLLPIPFFGIPAEPFLHSTIEFKDKGIQWAHPELAEKARVLMRAWNAMRGITGWAGFWALFIALQLIFFKKSEFRIPLMMSISLLGVLFVFAPIPDGRYALFVLIVGQLALLANVFEWIQKHSRSSIKL